MSMLTLRRPAPRAAYTLAELVISMSSMTILSMGLVSSLYLAGRALETDGRLSNRITAAEIQHDMLVDLNLATSFSQRTADAVTFTVPDRDSDGNEEQLKYAWSGLPDARLNYFVNGSPAVTLLENVQGFQFDYGQRTVAVTPPVLPVLDPSRWGARWESGPASFGYEDIFANAVKDERRQIATKVNLPTPGTLNSITAYLLSNKSDAYCFAIYAHNSATNEPGVLLAQTGIANGVLNGWTTLNTPPTMLTAGTYWLALSFDDRKTSYREEPGGESEVQNFRASQWGFNPVWGLLKSNSDTNKVSIYANYSPN